MAIPASAVVIPQKSIGVTIPFSLGTFNATGKTVTAIFKSDQYSQTPGQATLILVVQAGGTTANYTTVTGLEFATISGLADVQVKVTDGSGNLLYSQVAVQGAYIQVPLG